MTDSWPDEILDEPAILSPRAAMERLTWQIRRYERYLETTGLDFRSQIVASDKLDVALAEYRRWFEQHEAERRIIRLESFAVMLSDRIEACDRRLAILQNTVASLQDVIRSLMDRMDTTEEDAP
jgi:uncharacterized coiled-coil protein SlyX